MIPGCSFTCELGDSCGGALTGVEISFSNISPWEINAVTNVVGGYNKNVCMRCTSNLGDIFENIINIVQNRLDCSNNLVPTVSPTLTHPFILAGS